MQITAQSCNPNATTVPVRITGIDVRVPSKEEMHVLESNCGGKDRRLSAWCAAKTSGDEAAAATIESEYESGGGGDGESMDFATVRCTADHVPYLLRHSQAPFECPYIAQQCCRNQKNIKPACQSEIYRGFAPPLRP